LNIKAEELAEKLEDWSEEEKVEARGAVASALLLCAEEALQENFRGEQSESLWRSWLEITGRPGFLTDLDSAERLRWSETCFTAIRRGHYSLEAMLDQRAEERGDQVFLQEWRYGNPVGWSYEQIRRQARSYAVAFRKVGGKRPRVAVFLSNCVVGASADLACLLYDILVTPLAVHLDAQELVYIFDRLEITVVVTDNDERARKLLEVGKKTRLPLTLFLTRSTRVVERGEAQLLDQVAGALTPEEIDAELAARPRLDLDEPCTVMFTSGSTGRPKGVVFTRYNLLSKRFARAAALPTVGDNEVLLSYLPLYHTFGRYLELLGTLFWRGTYVFAGNPSAETLLDSLPRVQPSGMIGIPLRWSQIARRCREAIEERAEGVSEEDAFRSVVGPRLRWGLSAAGYLAPRVFHFFQRFGLALCSGFGMTEATGGITMTPPGGYQENSVGMALPGMMLRFRDPGEMLIGGHYVARYLREDGEGLELEEALVEEGEEWLATGDLFQELEGGHLTIVDRIKDIYKNVRGQTVAPRRVEARFFGVPGIRNTFLVGDHRAYNALLIVPDHEDPVLKEAGDEESRREYFRQIVAAANRSLIPFERVINFALVDRNFEQERGELTPKGSFRRKVIEKNFSKVIDSLYAAREVTLQVGDWEVHIPRWFYRDLGILDQDIQVEEGGLRDTRRSLKLTLREISDSGRLRVGDLEYLVEEKVLNLGTFARQPRLWCANPELLAFAPCKAGWNVPLEKISPFAQLPKEPVCLPEEGPVDPQGVEDSLLCEVNRLAQTMLFGTLEKALVALEAAGRALEEADYGVADMLLSRIAALARHPESRLRTAAYRQVLLDEPRPDGDGVFFAFIESGQSFLDEESIEILATESLGPRRFQALRRRLLFQRQHYPWPAKGVVRTQFEGILRLLTRFVRFHPRYFNVVRQELAAWVQLQEDPGLAQVARSLFGELESDPSEISEAAPGNLEQFFRFDPDIPQEDREKLMEVFSEGGFLERSVRHAFECDFSLQDLASGGGWVAGHRGWGASRLFRVSLNTRSGHHYDLLVNLMGDVASERARETILWTLMVSGHSVGRRTMPRLGCMRSKPPVVTIEFVDGLTVGEKIRQWIGVLRGQPRKQEATRWRRLFVRGMATFFRAWLAASRSIVPGRISPRNVVVPEQDFHEGSLLLSLAGWQPYRSPLSLFRPLRDWFFVRTLARYPMLETVLDECWIFEACLEGLGHKEGEELLRELEEEAGELGVEFAEKLGKFLERLQSEPYVQLPLDNAVQRYFRWREGNPGASAAARCDLLEQLLAIYRLDRFGEMARYQLFSQSYFSELDEVTREAFSRLLAGLREGRGPATRMVELFDLQATLTNPEDRETFGRLVFPRGQPAGGVSLVPFGESDRRRVTVRTCFRDRNGDVYTVREALDAEEVGTLYRLYFLEHIPKKIQACDRHLVVTDGSDSIVAGLTYHRQGEGVVHMDYVVVKSGLTGRGIAQCLLDDFSARLVSIGANLLKTGFLYPDFLASCKFEMNQAWGGMVRDLTPPETNPEDLDPGARREE
jgi:long-subunit acyl-CoA synthetase (AMP-forming)